MKLVKKVLVWLFGDGSGVFEIERDARNEWRFVLKAGNNEVIAVSEGYKTIAGCMNGIMVIQRLAEHARIIEK